MENWVVNRIKSFLKQAKKWIIEKFWNIVLTFFFTTILLILPRWLHEHQTFVLAGCSFISVGVGSFLLWSLRKERRNPGLSKGANIWWMADDLWRFTFPKLMQAEPVDRRDLIRGLSCIRHHAKETGLSRSITSEVDDMLARTTAGRNYSGEFLDQEERKYFKGKLQTVAKTIIDELEKRQADFVPPQLGKP